MKYALLLSLLLVALPINANSQGVSTHRDNEKDEPKEWEGCDTFLAPSSVEGSGWGVFAGRSFKKNEIVEISPLYLAMPHGTPLIKNSILDDFVYGYSRYNDETKSKEGLAAVTFGKTMFYNHLATPNIRLANFGREPTLNEPDIAQAVGWSAARDIEAGEELFSSYGLEDGGKQWFAQRRLEQRDISAEASRKTGAVFAADSAKYCAKTLAGIGEPGWHNLEKSFDRTNTKSPYTLGLERLHPNDNPVTICKQDVLSGTVLEMAPGLILSKAYAEDSLLGHFCIFWMDLKAEQQAVMTDLYEKKEWVVQYQGWDTSWVRGNKFEGFEEVAIFPVAGNIGLVLKVSPDEDPNCKLEITSSGSLTSAGGVENTGSAGIILSLIATRNIESGEVLRLDVHDSSNARELDLLYHEMKITGQPIPHHIKMRHENEVEDQHDDDNFGEEL